MTEAEWLSSTDPAAMLSALGDTMTPRKAVLWGVDCRRRLAVIDFMGTTARAVDTAERWADGAATDNALRREYDAAYNAREAAGRMILGDPDGTEPHSGTAIYYGVEATVALVSTHIHREFIVAFWPACRDAIRFVDTTPDHSAVKAVERMFAERLRDIVGNPFRPVAFDPAWRTATAFAVAEGVYAERAFDRLPILADALQDAGCEDAAVLGHLRGAGPHVRGCWVLDLVLGKE